MLVWRVRAGARAGGEEHKIAHGEEQKQIFGLYLHFSGKSTDSSMGRRGLPVASYGHVVVGFTQT